MTLFKKKTVYSSLVFFAVSALVGHFLASLWGELNFSIAALALLVGSVVAIFFPVQEEGKFVRWNRWEKLGYSLFLIFLCRSFYQIFYGASKQWKTGLDTNLGDLPLHLTYIRHLASGAQYPPENPFFSGLKLNYPLGSDLFNALFEVLGVPTSSHLFSVIFVSTLLLFFLLHRMAGVLGVFAFFFSGGFLGWMMMSGHDISATNPLWAWKNFFITLWMPQRGLLFAIPAGLVLLDRVHKVFLSKTGWTPLSILIFAVLPFFHLHTFFYFALFLSLLSFIDRTFFKKLLPLAPAVPVAGYFVLRSLLSLESSVVRFDFFWTASVDNFLLYSFANFCPWLLLFAYLVFLQNTKRHRIKSESPDQSSVNDPDRYLHLLVLAHLFLFIVFLNVMFAPWTWDNIKLLMWPYLALVILLAPFWQGLKWSVTGKAVVLCLVFAGGFFEFFNKGGWRDHGRSLYSVFSVNRFESTIKNISPDRVFATAPVFNHPVSFHGRKIVLGYQGHIWSHGINEGGRQALLHRIMTGDSDWLRLCKDLGIDYIYWGEHEKKHYRAENQPWRKSLRNISKVDGLEIYEISTYEVSKEN